MSELRATLPARWYVDPERYARERRSVFGTEWLWFASESQLTDPCSYVAETYAGWPLMVVRGNDGVLRGFHNVCRHRAGPLLDDGGGACRSLVCRYHGWAYDVDGRLRSARDFGAALDADEFALHPIKVASWRGQVFVNLDTDAPPLEADLGAFLAESDGFPLETMTLVRAFRHDLACNWKTYADNYLEGYHIPLLHPELNRQFDAKRYRVDLGDRYCRHSAPARDRSEHEGGAGRASAREGPPARERSEQDVGDGRASAREGPPARERSEQEVGDGRWLFRWPNLAMNVYGDSMNIEVIVPTGAETCTVLYNHFFVDPDAREVHDVIAFSDLVMEEDRQMVERVQRNLASGVYDEGMLSPRHEHGVLQFHDLVRAAADERAN